MKDSPWLMVLALASYAVHQKISNEFTSVD